MVLQNSYRFRRIYREPNELLKFSSVEDSYNFLLYRWKVTLLLVVIVTAILRCIIQRRLCHLISRVTKMLNCQRIVAIVHGIIQLDFMCTWWIIIGSLQFFTTLLKNHFVDSFELFHFVPSRRRLVALLYSLQVTLLYDLTCNWNIELQFLIVFLNSTRCAFVVIIFHYIEQETSA